MNWEPEEPTRPDRPSLARLRRRRWLKMSAFAGACFVVGTALGWLLLHCGS